jgi:hypothetical protein
MTTTFFISETKLRIFTDVTENLDTEFIKNAVREAQDIEISRIIGTKLYDKLIADINAGTLSGEYKTLMDDYIQDALLYWAYYYSLDAIYLKPRNSGLVIGNGGENSNSVDRDLYNVKRQNVKNKAEWYSNKLSEYILEKGSGVFPELGQSTELYESTPDYSTQYKSPIVMGDNYLQQVCDAGIPVTRGKAFSHFPPSKTRNIK